MTPEEFGLWSILISLNGILLSGFDFGLGMLYETLRADMPEFTKFGQVYLVHDFSKGIVRAFHRHLQMWDYFIITRGTGKFCIS
jgi:hypothetical protein